MLLLGQQFSDQGRYFCLCCVKLSSITNHDLALLPSQDSVWCPMSELPNDTL